MALLKIRRKDKVPGFKKAGEAERVLPILPRDQLGITDAAALRIEELKENKDESHFLRIAIRGGGCSGLSIHYEMSQQSRGFDQAFFKGKARVVIDEKSLSILGGATLDVREYLGSKEFFLANNPKEKQCSCGQSFSL